MVKLLTENKLLVVPPYLGGERLTYPITEANFYKKVPKGAAVEKAFLIIGFDTEYQTMPREDDPEVFDDNEVLSYQYCCTIITPDNEGEEVEWSGIVLPESSNISDRLDFDTFVSFAIGHGHNLYPDLLFPREIYLVAHFTRADIPAFKDYKVSDVRDRHKLNFQNLRNTFVSVKQDINIPLTDAETGGKIDVKIKIRDTIHLAPQGSNSLLKLGDLLNFPKIKLADTPEEELEIKKNMRLLFESDWEKFKQYAIRDAEVCTRYIADIIRVQYAETGKFILPLTLTSIGVSLLIKHWQDQDPPINSIEVVGKEIVKVTGYNKNTLKPYNFQKSQYVRQVYWNVDFFTECYSGGRNEQFWFGPSHEDKWFDYDLSSAYPSAMSLIREPDWSKLLELGPKDEAFFFSLKSTDMAFAYVKFEFPKTVRFPVLPVRTEKGILFPRTGVATTHISEILLAKSLGCKIELIIGRHIPYKDVSNEQEKSRSYIFMSFLQECIRKRQLYDPKTLKNLFWKEIANSTYGKTAQGLRERRIYNLKANETEALEESKITNPCFASFITAFCRGTLGEIMNNLPRDTNIFSVTTDGFLTNATEEMMEEATKGVLCNHYQYARKKLANDGTIYETKHIVKQLVGWRTRAQATLKPSDDIDWAETPKDDQKVVLAKGGIKLPKAYGKSEENIEIVRMFFNRTPDDEITLTLGDGIRNMYNKAGDLVYRTLVKRLSMEFDWKRKPFYVGETNIELSKGDNHRHIFYSTQPWESVDDFMKVRGIWEEYNKQTHHCIKTIEDYEKFSAYVESKLSLTSQAARYLKKENGDLVRLRRDLITAWRHVTGGTHKVKPQKVGNVGIFADKKLKSHELAHILTEKCGIPCSKMDVDNGRKIKVFTPHTTPNNEVTRVKLRMVKDKLFPELDVEVFLAKKSKLNLDPVTLAKCSLSQKIV